MKSTTKTTKINSRQPFRQLKFMFGLSFLLWWVASPAWFSSQAVASSILEHEKRFVSEPIYSGQTMDVQFRFVDQQSGEGIPFVYVFVEELQRSATTDKEGLVVFDQIPEGSYTLSIQRIGYGDIVERITVQPAPSTQSFLFVLQSESLDGEEVTIQESQDGLNGFSPQSRLLDNIRGEDLRQSIGATLAEVLSTRAGFQLQSMGGATARPVIRGLTGERVSIMKNGLSMGDVSGQSGDHAVSESMFGTEQVDLLRGPYALLYSGGNIHGLIQVNQSGAPGNTVKELRGQSTVYGQSGAPGASAQVQVDIPLGNRLSGRIGTDLHRFDDMNAPKKTILNTQSDQWIQTAGVRYAHPWATITLSGSWFRHDYGIPPDPVAGHPSGVYIEMTKPTVEWSLEKTLSQSRFKQVRARGSWTDYQHQEIEASGVIGTEFIRQSFQQRIDVPFVIEQSNGEWKGQLGAQTQWSSMSVFGASMIPSDQWHSALFGVIEKETSKWTASFGARWQISRSTPVRNDLMSDIGVIESKSHQALSGAFTLTAPISDRVTVSLTGGRTSRLPTLNELFSEGPHLASYTYEVGNPAATVETAWVGDFDARAEFASFAITASVYGSLYDTYLVSQNTGDRSPRFANLFVYQVSDQPARIVGFDLESEWQFSRQWSAVSQASWVRGEFESTEGSWENLPLMAPFKTQHTLQWRKGPWSASSTFLYKGTQNKTGPFETPTEGYIRLDARTEYRWLPSGSERLWIFSLRGKNITNTTYRDHLSLIKEVFPAPGFELRGQIQFFF